LNTTPFWACIQPPRDKKALAVLAKFEKLSSDINELRNQIELIDSIQYNNFKQKRNSKSLLIEEYELLVDKRIDNLFAKENFDFVSSLASRIGVCKEILASPSNKWIVINAMENRELIGLEIDSEFLLMIQEGKWPRGFQVGLINSVHKIKADLDSELSTKKNACLVRLRKIVLNDLINENNLLKIEIDRLDAEEKIIFKEHRHQIKSFDPQVQDLLIQCRCMCPGLEQAVAIADRFTSDFKRLFESVEQSLRLSILQPIIQLDTRDMLLIYEWFGDKQADSSYWKTAMESARKAEKALINQLATHNKRPEDLSLLQIVKPEDQRWKRADIQISGEAWDVKNARRSYNSKSTYSEHCVPRFKIERGLGNVAIAGILSPYPDDNVEPTKTELNKGYEKEKNVITTSNLDVETSSRVWLGIVDKEIIERLQVGFKDCSNYLLINFRNIDTRGTYMPPWVFDYPKEYYAERDKLIEDLRKRYETEALCLPIGQAILLGAIVNQDIDNNIEIEAIKLQNRIQELGLSRPVLFLHVLSRFCEAIHQKIPFNAAELRICLSLEYQNSYRKDSKLKETPKQAILTSRPLGVADPLKTIYRLIDVLEDVAKYCQNQAAGFRSFRLSGPGILSGVDFDGNQKTILAYCGGWKLLSHRNDHSVRCGTNPLYLGQNVSCPECGKLICHNCGFCTKQCNLCAQNQKNSISTKTSSPESPTDSSKLWF